MLRFTVLLVILTLAAPLLAQPGMEPALPLPRRPDSLRWTEQLRAVGRAPRLILTPPRLTHLRKAIQQDSLTATLHDGLVGYADSLLTLPPLTYTKEGRRLLNVSREALRRLTTLALLYRTTEDVAYLERLDQELRAISNFPDWNPSHFLDVAEMMLGVALSLDWTQYALPPTTVRTTREALLQYGLLPALQPDHWWIDTDNNWNQVCHGGTIAAALLLADTHPKLAYQAIDRALEHLPSGLRTYAPNGAYPEGPGYWAYATGYTVATIELLRTALGDDYGVAAYPGFRASATYRVAAESPTGQYYNYGDNRLLADRRGAGAELLAWFAQETGQSAYLRPRQLRQAYRGEPSRLAALALPWVAAISDGSQSDTSATPSAALLEYHGGGINPVFVLRDAANPSFYLAGKGGRGSVNHGNLDAGSFVFELDSVRWSIDPGVQRYNDLEQLGFDLWSMEQGAPRWTLLSKGNYFHSTLTVNDSLHRVAGFAPLRRDSTATTAAYTTDLSEVLAPQVRSATRTWRKRDARSFELVDSLQIDTLATRSVTWQWLTQAEVELLDGGAVLHQAGKSLRLTVLAPAGLHFSVVQLDPPPLPYDLRLPDLKRIELRVPAYVLAPADATIHVLVSPAE